MTAQASNLAWLLSSPQLEFMMEAHNALTARIVEDVGFKAIWASGLSISAQLGVRDCNEASWTQVLDVVEFMSDAVSIPILLDGDTGYGNFNNVRRLVRKLEQRSVAGVCLEDKLFPKANSFAEGARQPLATIEEFTGKIKAGKDSQSSSSFSIVARVEALIAGWPMAEALRRAEAYRCAGADAILIHSKRSDSTEIEAFMREWGGRHPVVIVPTKYYRTQTSVFRELGVSVVIWANHCLRASIASVKDIVGKIFADESVAGVEAQIAPIAEVFRLQRSQELARAESVYLPTKVSDITAVVLAANPGTDMGELTEDRPKAMIRVNGIPILHRLMTHLTHLALTRTVIIRGHCKETICIANAKMVDNDEYVDTKGVFTLDQARDELVGNTLICYGDSLFDLELLESVISGHHDFRIVVDTEMRDDGRVRDLVTCSAAYAPDVASRETSLTDIAVTADTRGRHGVWSGLLFVSASAMGRLHAVLASMRARPDYRVLHLADLIRELLATEQVSVRYTEGGWADVDRYRDLEQAGSFV